MDDDDGARTAREPARHVLGGRSERLGVGVGEDWRGTAAGDSVMERVAGVGGNDDLGVGSDVDRKSTRLNSSHRTISYAVFCWKKKTGLPDSSYCVDCGVTSVCGTGRIVAAATV